MSGRNTAMPFTSVSPGTWRVSIDWPDESTWNVPTKLVPTQPGTICCLHVMGAFFVAWSTEHVPKHDTNPLPASRISWSVACEEP